MVKIRPAAAADIPTLVSLAEQMHAESPYFSRFKFLGPKVAALLTKLLEPGAAGGVLVAQKDGMIVGMAAAFVYEHFFGDDKVASDLAVYVVREQRGSTTGIKLIRALENMCRDLGAKDITLGVSTEIEAERTAELYQCIGYRQKGRMLTKELF